MERKIFTPSPDLTIHQPVSIPGLDGRSKTPESRQSVTSPLNITTPLYPESSSRYRSSINSSVSDIDVCRVCHGGTSMEQLLSLCYCSGSMGKLHLSCLQRWLGSSNKTSCEICNFQFTIERKTKPFRQFLRNPGSIRDKKHLMCDMACFLLLTPLSTATAGLCIHGATQLDYSTMAILGLCTLALCLVILYTVWLIVCLRHNINLWKDWKQFNQDVKLKCQPPDHCANRSTESTGTIPVHLLNSAHSATPTGIKLSSIEIPIHRQCVPYVLGPSNKNPNKEPNINPSASRRREYESVTNNMAFKSNQDTYVISNPMVSPAKPRQTIYNGMCYGESVKSRMVRSPDHSFQMTMGISDTSNISETSPVSTTVLQCTEVDTKPKTSVNNFRDNQHQAEFETPCTLRNRCEEAWNTSRTSNTSSESSARLTDPELVSINFPKKKNKEMTGHGGAYKIIHVDKSPSPVSTGETSRPDSKQTYI